MSETFEISDTSSSSHSLVSENGKKYYCLNPPPAAETKPETSQAQIEVVESGPLVYASNCVPRAPSSGPMHYYGDTLVVRNAREMFNNIDILADGRYFCCVCKRPYKTHATLTAHLRGSHLRQESRCLESGCNHVSLTENERRKHQKMHDKTKYPKFSRESLELHQKIENVTIPEPKYPGENVLREQTNKNTKEVPGMNYTVDKRGKTKYSCTKCEQHFHNQYYAARHSELHSNAPKQCFYCGEIRQGTMDLQVHYMRFHKQEGVRTITCKACERAFTTTTLFRNHANQTECELACRNLLIRQDIYYGELPEGTMIDALTLNRLNFFRKRQEEREQMGGTSETVKEEPADAAVPSSSASQEDIFDCSSNSLIKTEFGLKKFKEFKTSRATTKRGIDDGGNDDDSSSAAKKVLTAQNTYSQEVPMTTATTQQNLDWNNPNIIYPPVTFGYDPLIGTYPDFQPMQQFTQFQSYYSSQPPAYQEPLYNDIPVVKQEEVTTDSNYSNPEPREPLSGTSDIASELLNQQEEVDVVFEELDKLDFVMPTSPDPDNNDDDLEGMFNF
ncbi:unnamed protein product [Caenorhabditis nigoni]